MHLHPHTTSCYVCLEWLVQTQNNVQCRARKLQGMWLVNYNSSELFIVGCKPLIGRHSLEYQPSVTGNPGNQLVQPSTHAEFEGIQSLSGHKMASYRTHECTLSKLLTFRYPTWDHHHGYQTKYVCHSLSWQHH